MIKVAAFLLDTTLFCINTSDIKGIYSITNAHSVIERNDLFCHTCYSSLLQETYHIYNWNDTRQTMQGCFLLNFKVAFPFDALVGVYEIDDESLKKERPSLFEVQSKANISIKGESHAVQLLNTKTLAVEFSNTNEYVEASKGQEESVQENSAQKALVAKTPETKLSIPYEYILKIIYKPRLIQRYPIKSNILGKFEHNKESFESICLDNTDTIYAYHIHVKYEGQEYVLNCENYFCTEQPPNDKEQTQFKTVISNLPRVFPVSSNKMEAQGCELEEDFVFYKSSVGTCAVETSKISKIALNDKNNFSIILQSGTLVSATAILGVHKSRVSPCHGLINNKIVLMQGLSALYPIE